MARDINQEHADSFTKLDKLACWVTERVGTMGFFLTILVWTVIWLAWNFLAPKKYQFDPPMSFVFWLFISNCIQILLMPLIMIGQNLQGRHAELRAENDFEINKKAELEICRIIESLDKQNAMIEQLVAKAGP